MEKLMLFTRSVAAHARKPAHTATAPALGFLRGFSDVNREFGAERLAEMTAHAALCRLDNGIVVTLDIESTGHFQYAARTVLDAEFAALAALFNNKNGSFSQLDFVNIKGRAPEFHRVCFPDGFRNVPDGRK